MDTSPDGERKPILCGEKTIHRKDRTAVLAEGRPKQVQCSTTNQELRR